MARVLLGALGASSSCLRDSRSLHRASEVPAQKPSPLGSRSWALCSLVGPRTGQRGVYGTDLGFTVKQPNTGRLSMLFGDTVAKPVEGCEYPVFHSDDLQGSLPAVRPAVLHAGPPTGPGASAPTPTPPGSGTRQGLGTGRRCGTGAPARPRRPGW